MKMWKWLKNLLTSTEEEEIQFWVCDQMRKHNVIPSTSAVSFPSDKGLVSFRYSDGYSGYYAHNLVIDKKDVPLEKGYYLGEFTNKLWHKNYKTEADIKRRELRIRQKEILEKLK